MNTQQVPMQVPMNVPQMQVPVVSQPNLPAGVMPFPAMLGIKNETCTSIFDLVKQYWWVLLLLVVAFLYYRQNKNKKDEEDEDTQVTQATSSQ